MAIKLPEDNVELARLAVKFGIPHLKALGVDAPVVEKGRVVMRLPWREDLVGNAETGVLHGGAITSLIDTAGGMAVMTMLEKRVAIATIDLRIDYLKPARPREDLFAEATCYRMTRHVAFIRATAYQGEAQDAIAYSVGTFMVGSSEATLPTRREELKPP